jgi:hypothetical protein
MQDKPPILICVKCKTKLARVDLAKLDEPIRGDMFYSLADKTLPDGKVVPEPMCAIKPRYTFRQIFCPRCRNRPFRPDKIFVFMRGGTCFLPASKESREKQGSKRACRKCGKLFDKKGVFNHERHCGG